MMVGCWSGRGMARDGVAGGCGGVGRSLVRRSTPLDILYTFLVYHQATRPQAVSVDGRSRRGVEVGRKAHKNAASGAAFGCTGRLASLVCVFAGLLVRAFLHL